jgi:alkanesulfonate monooxygenase SsuD/methylene tetrahydromethanopterin reductase-like flavin-dependent oxidoreductase (luciferase family)
VRRIAEHADGWMPMDSGPEAIASGLASIRRASGERGRLLDGFAVRAHAPLVLRDRRPDLDATLAGLGALADVGATHAGLALGAFCREREQVRPFLEAVSRCADR